jgi:BioD-like phosphotransacetylase family protein
MAVLYVASDQPGAGKTALCATLADELNRRGKRAAVFKPLGRVDGPGSDPDAETFERLLGRPNTEWPAPLPRRRVDPKLLDGIRDAAAKLSEGLDVLLVEGSSDISPAASSRLADALDARVVMVLRFQPGLESAHLKTWRTTYGERLLGFVINGLTRYQVNDTHARLLPAMASDGLKCLGVVPEDRRLLASTVGQLVSHLEGRIVQGEEFMDAIVEHFLVGGFLMDPGHLYFALRSNKAVIVRGDRPDMQMAALQTPTACLLLTKGIEPIEYVRNEAELEEVPIVVVEPDTLTTMDSVSSIVDGARFDHPAKLDRFAELLREHVEIDAILPGLGLAA